MKKILTFCILILLVPGLFGFTAYAYDYQPVKYKIEVEVTLGGTVKIIPNVNCPIPEKTALTLKDGEIGRFDIDFVEPGVFDYTVKTVPDDRDIIFDDTIYNIKIYVTDRDGTLEANMIASKGEEKYSRLIFVNTEKGGDEPTTNPTDSSDKGDSPLDINRNPKTGDDARMELSFLFAMIASAGLLTLSIVYLIDTRKMINKKNKEDN
ncbi:pilin isopeptide linkage domain-containing protein [Ruminococcaceae bacterium P7]|nr:pilin isopeptide linkage domain-containing protein [Ruminococcaceae bacterium P7]